MKEFIIGVDSIASISMGGNYLQLYLGSDSIEVCAGPGESNCYEITLMRTSEESGEEVFFSFQFPLTAEEFDAAWYHSMEDFMFVDDIDSLVVKRVTRDILTFFLMSLGKGYYDEWNDMDNSYKKEWEAYAKYLIHERMEGRTIAGYHPGYEPEDDLKQNEENKSE